MSKPERFRKKPVVIEAMLYTVGACRAIHDWIEVEHEDTDGMDDADVEELCSAGIEIVTLEGAMIAEVGDWIIRGVKGEFYPCKPDIFAATYDPEVSP